MKKLLALGLAFALTGVMALQAQTTKTEAKQPVKKANVTNVEQKTMEKRQHDCKNANQKQPCQQAKAGHKCCKDQQGKTTMNKHQCKKDAQAKAGEQKHQCCKDGKNQAASGEHKCCKDMKKAPNHKCEQKCQKARADK